MNPLDTNLIENCRRVEREMSQAWGGFALFGLFERDETAGKWDILVSAPWLTTDLAGIRRVVDALVPHVSKAEWLESPASSRWTRPAAMSSGSHDGSPWNTTCKKS